MRNLLIPRGACKLLASHYAVFLGQCAWTGWSGEDCVGVVVGGDGGERGWLVEANGNGKKVTLTWW